LRRPTLTGDTIDWIFPIGDSNELAPQPFNTHDVKRKGFSMKKSRNKTISPAFQFSVLFAILVLVTAPAMARTNDDTKSSANAPATQGTPAQEHTFDEQTLDNFATATVALSSIQSDFSQQLQGVQSQEEAIEIQQRMNQKMVEAVQDRGLDVETYNAIANQISVNPAMEQQMQQMIQEKTN
jgi:hypothetical protein